MSQRAISPLKDDRSTKRSKTVTPPPANEKRKMMPENIAEVVPGGDSIIVLTGGISTAPGTPIGLRVSSHALSLASAVFKAKFATQAQQHLQNDEEAAPYTTLVLPEEDGDAMVLLCNILHLRNDKLPTRLLPNLLRRLGTLACKYECIVAAGRATVQWFDTLYFATDPGNLWEIIEAAHIWDEATFFARFTSMWMLKQSMFTKTIQTATTPETQRLAIILAERVSMTQTQLRTDIDSLVAPCAQSFSDEASHYINYPPGLSPAPSETANGRSPSTCYVDSEGAKDYLGALRDAHIWPSTCWVRPTAAEPLGTTIGHLMDKIKAFAEPEYDDVDRCEGCLMVKIEFTEQLERIKEAHEKRLWGLCLDCYNKSAGGKDVGGCRYEHEK